jgi:SAM-dependent methyltransferase
MPQNYVIRGGIEGRERLRVLARAMWPSTRALLDRVGVPPAGHCLDLGCGGGDVTIALARLAPQGTTVGIDMDEAKLELARAEAEAEGVDNVHYRAGDVTLAESIEGGPFDLVYSRFLLTHLADPSGALDTMTAALSPGGVVVVEDIDISGSFCYPPSTAFWRYVDLYSLAAESRGCDPDIGQQLPTLLREAGLRDIDLHVVQPVGLTGEVKTVPPLTLEAIADSVVEAKLTSREELADIVAELWAFAAMEGTVLSLPRVVQAWGRSGT